MIEHMDSQTATKVSKCLAEQAANVYFSMTEWEVIRDLEFFFPCLEGQSTERTLGMIKPGVAPDVQDFILNSIRATGLLIVAQKDVRLTQEEVYELNRRAGAADAEYMVSAESTLLMLEGPGAIDRWKLLCGPEDPESNSRAQASTIRGTFATSVVQNVVHCSKSSIAASADIKNFFGTSLVHMIERSLCILKPEAVPFREEIRNCFVAHGFEVTKEQALTMSPVRVEELLKNQRTTQMSNARRTATVRHLSSAPVFAMVLTRVGAVDVLQQVLGPESPKDAYNLNPKLLRGVYGHDSLKNGFWCSDSVKAADLDVNFVFPDTILHKLPNEEQVGGPPQAPG